jgi:hypothetical protein
MIADISDFQMPIAELLIGNSGPARIKQVGE